MKFNLIFKLCSDHLIVVRWVMHGVRGSNFSLFPTTTEQARLGKRKWQDTVSHTSMRYAWMLSLSKELDNWQAAGHLGSAIDKVEVGKT
ncbi:hypothetical protein N7516_006318 [Penicillium verrucosum]|uniref:uncharacterized protein n=1 Tax=Penicillium verrucosum TaxID=60171 RepID=UPI002545B6EE|nr:uncharacterized protein N7516_006318 [Penicillium verrucosum]KAJ5931829.1 hypothetical protein N7516_006318 [Penicillium verrucosum]